MGYIKKRFKKSYRLAVYKFQKRWPWGLVQYIKDIPNKSPEEIAALGRRLTEKEWDIALEELFNQMNGDRNGNRKNKEN